MSNNIEIPQNCIFTISFDTHFHSDSRVQVEQKRQLQKLLCTFMPVVLSWEVLLGKFCLVGKERGQLSFVVLVEAEVRCAMGMGLPFHPNTGMRLGIAGLLVATPSKFPKVV